mmetsp:Transcript_63093/g.112134  ORF Transcript_63093/g.112134 Transcript_63093/m.112134 type:complete len:207 (-) Transcript_63093:701-1321(-)
MLHLSWQIVRFEDGCLCQTQCRSFQLLHVGILLPQKQHGLCTAHFQHQGGLSLHFLPVARPCRKVIHVTGCKCCCWKFTCFHFRVFNCRSIFRLHHRHSSTFDVHSDHLQFRVLFFGRQGLVIHCRFSLQGACHNRFWPALLFLCLLSFSLWLFLGSLEGSFLLQELLGLTLLLPHVFTKEAQSPIEATHLKSCDAWLHQRIAFHV